MFVPAPHAFYHCFVLKNLKGGAKIAPGKMYIKVDHRRDDDLGPTLNSGTVGVKLVER